MYEPFRIANQIRAEWVESGKKMMQVADKMHLDTFTDALPDCIYNLQSGETYFMDKAFCALVDHARLTLPDNTQFDKTWMQSENGWMWVERPFKVPDVQLQSARLEQLTNTKIMADPALATISAVGWRRVPAGTDFRNTKQGATRAARDGVHFICYLATYPKSSGVILNNSIVKFYSWSYFLIYDGEEVGERLRRFEEEQAIGGYQPGDMTLHEMRWIYTAFYLMSQKLAATVAHAPSRTERRQALRVKAPEPKELRVVTLRRLLQDRKSAGAENTIDWQWQWEVRGHWRNAWYPSEGVHRPIFISAYVKGPADRPFKESTVSFLVNK
jgi:hypothetical protein